MPLNINYSAKTSIVHLTMDQNVIKNAQLHKNAPQTPPSPYNRSEASSKNETIQAPKFDTINNRFHQYELFGAKYETPYYETISGGDTNTDSALYETIKPHSLFSRSGYNSVEEELAKTPYAFKTIDTKTINKLNINNESKNKLIKIKNDLINSQISPSRDLEDDRYFSKNRAVNIETASNLFGSLVEYGSNSSPEDEIPAFCVTDLIHAQDRYFDLSKERGGIPSLNLGAKSKSDLVRPFRDGKQTNVNADKTVSSGVTNVALPSKDNSENNDKEAFKVVRVSPAGSVSNETESDDSASRNSKTLSAIRRHKESAFAILTDKAVIRSRTASPVKEIIVNIEKKSYEPRNFSPPKARSCKSGPTSKHTTPIVSRSNSPHRHRTSSLSKIEKMSQTMVTVQPILSFDNPLTPRNYIKENIEEVHELSEFNREKNEDLAEQKRREEEEALLLEMGILNKEPIVLSRSRAVSRSNSPSKINLRSRSNSPSAILHYEKISKDSSDFINPDDGMKRSVTHRSRMINNLSKSQPHSKTNSPKHVSKIPKRQNSVSPTRTSNRKDMILIDITNPSGNVHNTLNKSSRFISNSANNLLDKNSNVKDLPESKIFSKSSQNLLIAPTNLKAKPPKSPNKYGGPPPSNKVQNSKRLSPIVGTPNKSPVVDDKAKKSKPATRTASRVNSPSKIPKKNSKTAGNTPNNSKPPSRSNSRAVSRDNSPDKKTSYINRMGPKSSSNNALNKTGANTGGKQTTASTIKRTTSKTSLTNSIDSKAISRNSSVKNLTRVDSNKSLLDKQQTLKKKDSQRNMKLGSTTTLNILASSKTNEKNLSSSDKKDKKSDGKGKVGTKSKATQEKSEGTSQSMLTQDNETQYDKLSNNNFNIEDLVPLTKKNVVSMTIAAITSQPLDVAAKVTSQLPAAFEKAREKGIFERLSSTDSIMPNKTETDEKETNQKVLEKKASKTSITSVKEGPNSRNPSFIEDGNRLKPLQPPFKDPQIEKVRQKIDSILKSAEVSSDPILVKEPVAVPKPAEVIKEVTKEVAKEVTKDVKAEVTKEVKEAELKTEEIIKETKNHIVKEVEKKEEVVKDKVAEKVNENVNNVANKLISEVKLMEIDVKKNISAAIPPVEEPVKTDVTKLNKEVKKIEKQNIEPVVMIVNEKKLPEVMKVEITERVTETLVKGGPDVEVQSSNMSSPVNNASSSNSKTRPVNTTNGGLPKSTSTKGAARTPVPPPRNAPTQQNSQQSSSTTMSSKTEPASKKASITPSTTLSSKDQENANKKPANICQKLLSNCVGKSKMCMECCKKDDKKDEKDKEKEKKDKEKRKDENLIETVKDESNKEKKSILDKLKCKCCDKNVDEDKKDKDKKDENKKVDIGSLRQSNDESQSTGLFSCCKKKNRIGDSSSNSTMKSGEKPGCCSQLNCCKSQKQKQEEWAQRRDSILSQPPPSRSRWCACLPCCKPPPVEELSSSRRASLFSKNKSMSPTLPPEDTRPKLDVSLVEHASIMRGAIPVLPIPLAYFCLICNVLVPGLGTIFSGVLCLCFGKPRFSVHDGPKQRIGAFIINIFIGAGQIFTVLFCLVGWGWSIWWGTIMLKVAKKYRKLKELAAVEDVERAPVVTSQNHHGRPANGANA